MSLLRIDCPRCCAKYARQSEDFLYDTGHTIWLSCTGCDHGNRVTRAVKDEATNFTCMERSRSAAHLVAIEVYTAPAESAVYQDDLEPNCDFFNTPDHTGAEVKP